MNFSSISRASVIGRLVRLPLSLIPKKTVLPILQGPLQGKRWIVGSSSHGCWLGSYEFDKQEDFIKHVKSGDTVFDIGAHVGFYTLLSSQLVGSTGKVVAFEPLPSNIKYLHQHITINGAENIIVYEKAVSDHLGIEEFEIQSSSSMGHLSTGSNSHSTLTVEVIALDQFIAEENLPFPDVIKVDIEGEEYKFLIGARKLLEERAPKIFLATHGKEVHENCLAFLRSIGYEIINLEQIPLELSSEILAVKRNT